MPDPGLLETKPRAPRLAVWLALAALVLLLDQLTKLAVSAWLRPSEVRELTGFFNMVLVYNTGAAFSLLADAQGWQRGFFIAVGAIASIVIVMMLRRHEADRKFCFALSLILGGAIGNVLDRVALGHVIDFVQLHAAGYYWPAFNVADSAICAGAGLLIWDGLFDGRRKPAQTR